jgi:hypothetical protein
MHNYCSLLGQQIPSLIASVAMQCLKCFSHDMFCRCYKKPHNHESHANTPAHTHTHTRKHTHTHTLPPNAAFNSLVWSHKHEASTVWVSGSSYKTVCQKKELTCAGVVIDPDVSPVTDAHEGSGGVDTHSVLPAVVLPLRTLVDIYSEEIGRTGWAGHAWSTLGSSNWGSTKDLVQTPVQP